jgi:hypothetical protein
MQSFIFTFFLVSLNISVFFLLAVNSRIRIPVNRKMHSATTTTLLAVVIGFVVFGPSKYLGTFYMSAAIITLFGLRFLIYKFLSSPTENESKRIRISKYIFPKHKPPCIFVMILRCRA